MRLVLLTLGLSMAAATPALAQSGSGEYGARAEVRSGLGWQDGQSAQATLGAAIGYDFATGGGTFVGVEQSVDKVLTSQDKTRFATTARFGTALTPKDKVYGLAGYQYGVGPNATQVGAGVEHNFGPVYGKVEYRHNFSEDQARDSNAALVGFGVRF
ncbi:hypothetical protein GTZ99_04890 [Novosphingobium sp. FSY-8]|uniref:Outer membrane immunogenic protein n=1 Tax=Novosphingobium ovatum TaxID=1908523 RepID=A0ABW9XBG5_9SPHN|nr:porin family protein [Novosphingobium ovatum]NBC35890.1 hypothetical protein [Novosphingobium ovatum]